MDCLNEKKSTLLRSQNDPNVSTNTKVSSVCYLGELRSLLQPPKKTMKKPKAKSVKLKGVLQSEDVKTFEENSFKP